MHQLVLRQQHVTLSSSPPTTLATNMCVGGLLGSHMDIHVHSGSTSILVRTPLTMLMLMDCQSHTDLKLNATIFGHMQEGYRKALHMTVTVPVQPTQEPARRHLWDRTITVNPPLATLLKTISNSPITPSGTVRTATLEAVAVPTLLLRGLGGHSRRRPQRT